MKGYSTDFERENFACARMEGTNASFKDLAEVCGRIRGKNAEWALGFLELAAEGKIPVLYKRHNKRLGHRRELGGQRGRYPKKAAKAVLKVLKSALANGITRGMGAGYQIAHASANKKNSYGRVAPKGRWARSDYETSRIEILLKPLEAVPKGVEVRLPAKEKKEAPKKEEKPKEEKKPEKKEEPKKEERPKEEPKKEEKKPGEKPKEEPKKEEKKEPEKSDVKTAEVIE